ncbi:MAG TPA: helix-turn-helix transcriptional regulator [Nocardioides sp.]|nr:helix-turn-helix transcriptional regulator [Nocardioides sp.]
MPDVQPHSIEALRDQLGISVRSLARQAHVDHTHLGRWLAGQRAASSALVAAVLRALADLMEAER